MSLNFKEIEETISSHMDDQPYKMQCGGCGTDLEFCKKIDGDYDMELTVEPCETCMEESFQEGKDS